ncbi:MAG TPA: hypothetical protein VLA62_06140, partial [Solirubrobacterales bacterium]|nr:hypothetical protein [Solirubrobacterales bacterium]
MMLKESPAVATSRPRTAPPPSTGPAERARLAEDARGDVRWKRWGPYLSERQWGTVREDYSPYGNAWDYFSHDQARARAYRWGEDGLAGISDEHQRLCLALALWNGRDPILKERLFGLSGPDGNHGEDVKEYYFYLDATPTHTYMRALYKYPQHGYPYVRLVEESRRRGRAEPEFELLDTGVFDDARYFDVLVEYAKASPNDILVRVTVENAGPDPAPLHVLPTLWLRNTWSWGRDARKPRLVRTEAPPGATAVRVEHPELSPEFRLYAEGAPGLLFTENETNARRLFGDGQSDPGRKDAFHEAIVHGRDDLLLPDEEGTKTAAHYGLTMPPGGGTVLRLRLVDGMPAAPFGPEFDQTFADRRREADEFY